MGNNGGGSIFIALLLVAMVFGAGFLFSQDSNAAYNQQIAAEAAAQVSAAEKQAADAVVKAAAADTRAVDAEAKAAAADTRAVDAEAKAAAAGKRAAEAEAKAVEAQRNLAVLTAEHQQLVEQVAAEKNMANEQVIPVTSGGENPKRGKLIELWLLPGIGLLIIGMLAITTGQKMLRPGRRAVAANAKASSVTTVMMTREEARQYARIRRK